MRPPVMHTTLDGFFLHLRFGNWEEALGSTGYHVARINGVLDKNRLSVTIRNSTCRVDSRFVSNDDFHEDELKAWWSAAMTSGWKLPSQEELNTKLRERAASFLKRNKQTNAPAPDGSININYRGFSLACLWSENASMQVSSLPVRLSSALYCWDCYPHRSWYIERETMLPFRAVTSAACVVF